MGSAFAPSGAISARNPLHTGSASLPSLRSWHRPDSAVSIIYTNGYYFQIFPESTCHTDGALLVSFASPISYTRARWLPDLGQTFPANRANAINGYWPLTCSAQHVRCFATLDLALARYSFRMGLLERLGVQKARTAAELIAAPVILLAVLNATIPVTQITTHNILHHLNFLPLMVAGMLFGWRAAAVTSLAIAAVNAPLIAHHWVRWPVDAKDQIVELTIFSAAGLITGYLSDRERGQRRDLEQTRQELERVYLELRENVAEMRKAERLSAVGQLAASLAHEIRNPLASISGAAGILQRGSAPQEYVADSLEIIQKESQRLNKLLTGFLNFAKPRSPRLQRTDSNALLLSVVSLASHSASQSHVSLVHELHACPEIECDPEQMKQVLLNLVINAIDASPAGSEIRLRSVLQGDEAFIEVEDSGCGIPSDIVDKIFDPFFTTKAKGTGLGLAISSMIVSQHSGTLSFRASGHGGTTFRIQLPVTEKCRHGE